MRKFSLESTIKNIKAMELLYHDDNGTRSMGFYPKTDIGLSAVHEFLDKYIQPGDIFEQNVKLS